MSQTVQGLYKGFKVASSFVGKQYHIAKLTGDGIVDLATAETDVLVGVVQDAVAALDTASVALISGGGTSKVKLGGTVTRGMYITADSAGKGVQIAATGAKGIGMALESGVAGDIIEVALSLYRHVAGSSASASTSPSASASASQSPSASVSASRSPSSSASPS